ncbi:unnamed protein product, partial [marine sediment metagenome]
MVNKNLFIVTLVVILLVSGCSSFKKIEQTNEL